jgi:SAM-dependent methyltransferase
MNTDVDYFSGNQLYGDNFTISEIEQWYRDEQEAYADMYGQSDSPDGFSGKNLDILFGYKYIPNKKYANVLGFGASWGYELLPIIERIERLTIMDTSEQTVSNKLGNVTPQYVKPSVSGKIDFPDNTFDLITCFSTLHHIPNVTFVVSELCRVLQKGGILLLREPIDSMGDWRKERKGLTKHERGIPPQYLRGIIASQPCEVVKVTYHHFIYPFLQKLLHNPKFLACKWYLRIDYVLSKMFLWNYRYHPTNMLQRIFPRCVYYVIKKVLP